MGRRGLMLLMATGLAAGRCRVRERGTYREIDVCRSWAFGGIATEPAFSLLRCMGAYSGCC
ncbi:MAG: hypothetical protein ACLR2G_07875 [Phascolarctobacterium faecium]